MLPGAGRGLVSHLDFFTRPEGAYAIRNDAVFCPVTATDDITRPRGGYQNGRIGIAVMGREKGFPVGRDDELGCAFGAE